jgi:hypothetical protein
VRRVLRRIATDRERTGHRFGYEMIAEAGLVGQFGVRVFGRRAADFGFLIHSEPPERAALIAKSNAMKAIRQPRIARNDVRKIGRARN